MVNDYEKYVKILSDYEKGKTVEKGDHELIDFLSSVGLIRCGFDGSMNRTARTSDIGIDFIK